MHVFIPVTIFLLIPSAVEMSEATTGQFRQCFFPEWSNASQMRVSCQKENDTNDVTQIAQYCNDSTPICRKMNKPGVSLEKEHEGLCLTITNDSYDSWFCEAQIFSDDDEKKENFTVDLSKQPTNTSVFAADASHSQDLTNTSPSQESYDNTSTSPGPTDASPSSDMGIIAGVAIGLFIMLIIIGLCIYKKVKSSRKNNHLNCRKLGIEMSERGEIEALRGNGGETLALGQNG